MSTLDKQQQKEALRWLTQQARSQKRLYRLSTLLGLCVALLIIAQAFVLAQLLQKVIMDQQPLSSLSLWLLTFILLFFLRAGIHYAKENVNNRLGCAVRLAVRQQILDHLDQEGPAALARHDSGGLSTLLVEQIEQMHDFYAHYLPQTQLARIVPLLIVIVILPFNWAAALILLVTAPLIPLFMILVGMGSADANRKNFKALDFLSGYFLDRLRGLTTLQLFQAGQKEITAIQTASETFRLKTMDVLKLAFLSSAVLEFFTSISIAIVAVYFGFSYLGELNFGDYHLGISLFVGFFALILAPEFFQPLRDLGTFYHAKAQAIAAAINLRDFMQKIAPSTETASSTALTIWPKGEMIQIIEAENLTILSPSHQPLAGPYSFTLTAPIQLVIFGESGVGKSSFLRVLLGFLPYQGSLKINHRELSTLCMDSWRNEISWLGQSPLLLTGSIRDNLLLGDLNADEKTLHRVIKEAQLSDWIEQLPHGLETFIGEEAMHISVGQAQRIAIARALLKPHQLLLLDEPTASLDQHTQIAIDTLLQTTHQRAMITVTHLWRDGDPATAVFQFHSDQLIRVK